MIHEVDVAIRSVLRGGVLPDGAGDVAFETPTRDWAARRNAPTVNAYLYDIREEVARRERGVISERDAGGVVVRRRHHPAGSGCPTWSQRGPHARRTNTGCCPPRWGACSRTRSCRRPHCRTRSARWR